MASLGLVGRCDDSSRCGRLAETSVSRAPLRACSVTLKYLHSATTQQHIHSPSSQTKVRSVGQTQDHTLTFFHDKFKDCFKAEKNKRQHACLVSLRRHRAAFKNEQVLRILAGTN